MRAVVRASEMLALALGHRLAILRDSDDPLARAFADAQATNIQLRLWLEVVKLLGARFDRLPERRRPHYKPEERYRILRLKSLLCWSQHDTAKYLRLSLGTIARWEAECREEGTGQTLVRPNPPVRRFADVVRQLVQTMDLVGFGGKKKIAQFLTRAGWRLSARTVARIRKEGAPPPRQRLRPGGVTPPSGGVRARHPNHTWLMDVTTVRSLFGLLRYSVATVYDAFSRLPLATRSFPSKPTAKQVKGLLEVTRRRFGTSTILITDQGSEFTGADFRHYVDAAGIQHRFGAIGRSNSIALIERFWRTLKELGKFKILPPLTHSQLDERLAHVIEFYAHERPHEALFGQTPAEVYFGIPPKLPKTVPRGMPGERSPPPPFQITFLDEEETLPILKQSA